MKPIMDPDHPEYSNDDRDDAPMRTQCSWCFPAESEGYDPDASHGICETHLAEQRERIRKRKFDAGRPVLPDASDSASGTRGPSGRVEPSTDSRTGGGARERGEA